MSVPFVDIYLALPAFMLVLARISGLMLTAPFFSGSIIPTQVKAILVLAVSAVVFPMAGPHTAVPVTMSTVVWGMVGELALGTIVGIGVSLVLTGVQMGVQLASQQAGMALGEAFNPMLETSLPVVSELYFFVSFTVFLAVGGHRAMIRALLDSFETLPLMGLRVDESMVLLMISLVTVAFTVAIRVAGPMMLALLMSFITLGFLSRTVPQLNILTVGFPAKMMLALLIMALTIMSLEPVLTGSLALVMDELRQGLGIGAG
ncbi:MAG: flagellar biosynthetic protein FliR [Phycisphaerae bacterium]|nr:flagellar biosynthetic protein FliR [Phycisphaerae bacterium]